MSKMPNMGRRNIGAISKTGNIPTPDVQKQFGFAMEAAKINTGRVKDPDELTERFNQLFALAYEKGVLPRYEHLVLVSGLPKSTYYDYGNENYEHSPNPRFSVVIKRAKSIIAASEAGLAAEGKIPAPVYIFRSKNYEGLKDVQEVKTTNTYNTDPKDPEAVVQALPDIDEKNYIEIKND